MKKLFSGILLCCLVSGLYGQQKNISKVSVISETAFNKHLAGINLIESGSFKQKIKGVMEIETAKRTFVLKYDGKMLEYLCEGKLKGSRLIVVHKVEPNFEEYYLINAQTGKIDTLFDKPNFFINHKDFVCLQGAGTDVKQQIQLGRIEKGKLVRSKFINLPNDVIPESVYWLNQFTLVIKNTASKYYKLAL